MFFFFRVITGFVITLLSLHRFLLLLFFSAPAHERKKSENSRRAKRGCLKHPLVGIAEIAVLRQYDMVQKPDVNRLASPFQPACQVVVLRACHRQAGRVVVREDNPRSVGDKGGLKYDTYIHQRAVHSAT